MRFRGVGRPAMKLPTPMELAHAKAVGIQKEKLVRCQARFKEERGGLAPEAALAFSESPEERTRLSNRRKAERRRRAGR